MKIEEANAPQPGKRKMTDAEIKEAIKRDKEWMENLDPDEEIEVPEGAFNDLFGDHDNGSEAEDAEGDEPEIDDEEIAGAEDAGENDDEEDNDEDNNGDNDGIGGGKIIGALVGGIGGLVVGSILGAAILGDD